MQQRPDARVGKTFVMRLDIFFAEEHRHAAVFFPQNPLDFSLPCGFCKRGARPANPFGRILFVGETIERGDQTAGGFCNLICSDSYGQTIRDVYYGTKHDASLDNILETLSQSRHGQEIFSAADQFVRSTSLGWRYLLRERNFASDAACDYF